MKKPLIIFDFDGVIVDSFETSYKLLSSFAENPFSEEDYRVAFEGNVYDSPVIQAIMAKTGGVNDQNQFFVAYLDALKHLDPVPGIREAIEGAAKTHTLVVVSSTMSKPIREFLEHHGLLQYFDDVLGADAGKSKKEKIERLLNQYGQEASEVTFITDSLGDVKEVQPLGLNMIAVSWGYNEHERLEKAEGVTIVDDPEDLKKRL